MSAITGMIYMRMFAYVLARWNSICFKGMKHFYCMFYAHS